MLSQCTLWSDGIERTIAVADASQKSAFWDEARASVCCYWFDLRGREMLGRAWYEHSKKVLEAAGFVESRLEQGSLLPAWTIWTLRLSCTHTSMTSCLRSRKPPRNTRMQFSKSCAQASFETTVRLGCVLRNGQFAEMGNHIKVTQTKSTMSLECLEH